MEKPDTIPVKSGVYIFKKGRKILYVGKASNLKKRLAFYFRKNIEGKLRSLLTEANKLKWIETPSEQEALIDESSLIKKYRPKYNVLMRDDKNYFYVGITKEKYPRVFTTHEPRQSQMPYIGPFTSGSALKSTLKLLRKIFPYCTCKRPHKRPCLNSQIDRCPGYCCLATYGHLDPKKPEYKKNIDNVITILNGKKTKLLRDLKKRLKVLVKNQEFELAAGVRDQILGIENIFSHRPIFEKINAAKTHWRRIEKTLKELLNTKNRISRVEGYDISNISGVEATGSMVVFIDGYQQKNEYKKFRIKTIDQANDVGMLTEVIGRRLKHTEWNLPDLMLIDGGRPQLNTAIGELRKAGLALKIAVAALAKKEEELYTVNRNTPIRIDSLPQETALFLQRVRDESHRFAKKYHHKLREMSFRQISA